jgi:hypothetical protein
MKAQFLEERSQASAKPFKIEEEIARTFRLDAGNVFRFRGGSVASAAGRSSVARGFA